MTIITDGAISWTVTDASDNDLVLNTNYGQFVTGGYWVLAGTKVTAISPAPTTVNWAGTDYAVNGSEINPTIRANTGLDGRPSTNGDGWTYDAASNAALSLPLSLSAGQSLVSTEHALDTTGSPPTAGAPSGYPGTNCRALDNLSVLTCLASAPASNSFRPPWYGTTKTIWTQDDVDYTKLPGLTPPSDPTTGSFTWPVPLLNKVQFVLLPPNNNVYGEWFAPEGNRYFYPGSPAGGGSIVNRALLYCAFNFADAAEQADYIIQHGIDLYAQWLDDPTCYFFQAGFGTGSLMPMLFAGWMLNDADMMDVVQEVTPSSWYWDQQYYFAECTQWYYATTSGVSKDYRLPRARSDYPNGLPLYGDGTSTAPPYGANITNRDVNGEFDAAAPKPYYLHMSASNDENDNSGTYMYANTVFGMTSAAMVFELLKMPKSMLKGTAFLDGCWRVANDPSLCNRGGADRYSPTVMDVGTANAIVFNTPDLRIEEDQFLLFNFTKNETNTSVDVTASLNGSTPEPVYWQYSAGQGRVKPTVGLYQDGVTYRISYNPVRGEWQSYGEDISSSNWGNLFGNSNNSMWKDDNGNTKGGSRYYADLYVFGGTGNEFMLEVYEQFFKAKKKAVAF